MIKLNSYYIIIFLFFSTKVFCQTKNEKDIIANCKIYYLKEANFLFNKDYIISFIEDTINSEILPSKGFEDKFVFVKIKFRGNFQAFRKDTIPEFKYTENRVPFSCEYIIGMDINTTTFYKLKGFETNDFLLLFNTKYRKKDKIDFINQFWVSELDLDCLFDSFFGRKKDDRPSSCLIYCIERDIRFAKGNSNDRN